MQPGATHGCWWELARSGRRREQELSTKEIPDLAQAGDPEQRKLSPEETQTR